MPIMSRWALSLQCPPSWDATLSRAASHNVSESTSTPSMSKTTASATAGTMSCSGALGPLRAGSPLPGGQTSLGDRAQAAEHAHGEGAQRPAAAVHMERQRVVERDVAGSDAGQRERRHAVQ